MGGDPAVAEYYHRTVLRHTKRLQVKERKEERNEERNEEREGYSYLQFKYYIIKIPKIVKVLLGYK